MCYHRYIKAVCLTGVMLFAALSAWADMDLQAESNELSERTDLLAKQLDALPEDQVADSSKQSEINFLKSMLVNFISEQETEVAVASDATVHTISESDATPITVEEKVLAVLQMANYDSILEGWESPDGIDNQKAAPQQEPVAPDSSDMNLPKEEEEGDDDDDTPLPPAPRVQSSEEVKEANVSLSTQLRSLSDNEGSGVVEAGLSSEGASTVMYSKNGSDPSQAPSRTAQGGSLSDLVNLDFRNTDLSHVVAILALKANINIIAGADLKGTVTANLYQVPLYIAMETVLRMNGLGLVEENGIYFVVPYEEAASVNRKTVMVTLENANVDEVRKVLGDVTKGIREEAQISISANKASNLIIISAPKARVDELVAMVHQLDIAEPVLPTETRAISLNYSEPGKMLPLVEKMLSPRLGKVAADERARHLVVTDIPVVVEQIADLVSTLDIPTKQVLIESMVVEALLSDDADTGVKWLIDSVHRMARRQALLGEAGRTVGNIQELSMGADLEGLQQPGGLLSFSLLTDKIDWSGVIQGEVRNRNGRLLSNPMVLTVENEPANISIAQEVPYIELSQTNMGGSQTSTRFKEIGTVLTVTPRVTHDDVIICRIEGKESSVSGNFQGVPIEDKREISSTMRMNTGQTIFVGGLRKSQGTSTAKKIPVLGDLPIINFAFRSNERNEQINDLLVFVTCSVVDEQNYQMTPHQQKVLEETPPRELKVDAWETTMFDTRYPHAVKEQQWKWRREP